MQKQKQEQEVLIGDANVGDANVDAFEAVADEEVPVEPECGADVDFDMKLVGPSECDMKRVEKIKTSELLAVKLAERALYGLNSLDKCDDVWTQAEKLNVASKAGAIAVGPLILAEGVVNILGSALLGPLKRALGLKDGLCEDADEPGAEAGFDDLLDTDNGDNNDVVVGIDAGVDGGDLDADEPKEEEEQKPAKKNLFVRMLNRVKKNNKNRK